MQVRVCKYCMAKNPINKFVCEKCGGDISTSPMELDDMSKARKMYLICPVCESHIELKTEDQIVKECPVCHDYAIHSCTYNDIQYEDDIGKIDVNTINEGFRTQQEPETIEKARQIQKVRLINFCDEKEITILQGEFVLGALGDIEADYFYQNQYIGRKHCIIMVQKDHAYIQDNDSVNYTFLNGKKIRKQDGKLEIINGDRIKMANMEFEVQVCW